MKSLVASKFRKLVFDISELYQNARKAQVMFAWETGRRIVEVEQDVIPRTILISPNSSMMSRYFFAVTVARLGRRDANQFPSISISFNNLALFVR